MTLFFEKSSPYGWVEVCVEVNNTEEADAVLASVSEFDRIKEGSIELY
jgi:hypothetical protein